MQFLGKIIAALQTVMESLGVKMDTQVTTLGSMEGKLDEEITKLQGIIDSQYSGQSYIKASETEKLANDVDISVSGTASQNKMADFMDVLILSTGTLRLKGVIQNIHTSYNFSGVKLGAKINGVESVESAAVAIDKTQANEFSIDVQVVEGETLTICGEQDVTNDAIDSLKLTHYGIYYDVTNDKEIVM